MTTKYVVTDEQEKVFHKRRRELESRFFKGVLDPDVVTSNLQLLIEGKKVTIEPAVELEQNWITKILSAERQAHLSFFGCEFDLAEFEKILRKYGRKKVQFWKKLGMEPHFLPKTSMWGGDDYPGWKVKPERSFSRARIDGMLLRDVNGELKEVVTAELEGISVLIDTRLKPAYNNGKQMWLNDNLLGPIIKQLRNDGKINDYNPKDSRFNISANEWEKEKGIRPALAMKLGLEKHQIRLETTPERNAIPQIYTHMPRKDDHNTNTSVWTEEFYENRSIRLFGGNSGNGGLAYVHWNSSGYSWNNRSFRPLAVL